MWKNKHVILALLVAPVLAIIAWFSVDYFVAERPHAARAGASYPLVAKPNCRRPSDGCELVNEDFRITVSVSRFDKNGATVHVVAAFALAQVALGVANDGVADGAPTAFNVADQDRMRWRGRVAGRIDADTTLRFAAVADESTYYAEVPVTFFYASE